MVLINKAINEVTVKLVYYGPGLCGKTTNLEKIYSNPKLDHKGKMISMSTETDRTLFFDFMPMELGTVGGQKVRVQLYTVPGQVFYDATRKLVLRGADGVVFVADSQSTMREPNLQSLENLKTNLRLNKIDPDKVALVFQYNKRDLPAAEPVDEMNEYLKPGRAPVVEAIAFQGVGVTATLRQAVTRILDNLKNNVDISLHEAPADETPRIATGTAEAPAPPARPAAPRPPTRETPGAPQSPAPMPAFGAGPQPVDPALFQNVFAREPADDADPFGESASGDTEGLQRMLDNTRSIIQSLQSALAAAQEQERQLAKKLGL